MATLLLNIRRGSTPFYRGLRTAARGVRRFQVPVPRLVRPLLRACYHTHIGALSAFRHARAIFYCTPLFASRCERTGRALFVFSLPEVAGHTRIVVGDNVHILGKVGIASARVLDEPTLTIGNGVVIGHEVHFNVSRDVRIDDEVFIASRSTIADSDGHPHDPDLRVRHLPPLECDIRPVHICRRAWIGRGAQIRKGVTIGEAAIVGANSVVVKDVPPYCVAAGIPARVVGFVRRAADAPPGSTSEP